ncbi:hypothetical protein LC605_28745 [Nostoc sp. CHAB 5836]|nr:hypothetical protein [Nostoc sp. CHAB 5836]
MKNDSLSQLALFASLYLSRFEGYEAWGIGYFPQLSLLPLLAILPILP